MYPVPMTTGQNSILQEYLANFASFRHRSDMTDRPSRRWIPVAATVALAAVLLIAAILILPNSGKTTTVTSLRTTTAATSALTSLQTTGAALSASDYNS